MFFSLCLKRCQRNALLRHGTSTVGEKQLWSSEPDQSELVSFARYRKKSPSELRRDTRRAMTRQQQLLAQGQSVKVRTTFLLHKLLAPTLLRLKAQQPNPPSTIDDDSSDGSGNVQEEHVIAKEHDPDKEQNGSFSKTTQ